MLSGGILTLRLRVSLFTFIFCGFGLLGVLVGSVVFRCLRDALDDIFGRVGIINAPLSRLVSRAHIVPGRNFWSNVLLKRFRRGQWG